MIGHFGRVHGISEAVTVECRHQHYQWEAGKSIYVGIDNSVERSSGGTGTSGVLAHHIHNSIAMPLSISSITTHIYIVDHIAIGNSIIGGGHDVVIDSFMESLHTGYVGFAIPVGHPCSITGTPVFNRFCLHQVVQVLGVNGISTVIIKTVRRNGIRVMRHDAKAELLPFADRIIDFLVKAGPEVLPLGSFKHRPAKPVIFIQPSGISAVERDIDQVLVIPLFSSSTRTVQIRIGKRNDVKA